jgi:hypothetical protein
MIGRERRLESGAACAIRRQTWTRRTIRIPTAALFQSLQGENWRELHRSPNGRYPRFRPPRCALTAKYRVKPVRKTPGGALAIINLA